MPSKLSRVARGAVCATAALSTLLALASSCSRQTVTVQLHPFQASGDVTYVCRNPIDGSGRPLADCNSEAIARGEVDLYALLTQTATGEVAVINVPTDPANPRSDEHIIDEDPTVPGYGFLHVGAQPTRIVSTPGGSLSVVAVAEPGKPGLFALPTQCVGTPADNEHDRDLATWPACSLPAAPGNVAVVLAPESSTQCDGSVPEPRVSTACLADVTTEAGPSGRRKIVVSMPELGELGVIDADWLARGEPGEFPQCKFEARFKLKVELPATGDEPKQILPADVKGEEANFASGATTNVNTSSSHYEPSPSGFALAKNTLYVGDSVAPVIHVVDFSDPCAPVEEEPLLARSLYRPDRVVTTSRVAVSPLTPSGRQFVYAIDQYDSPTASIMAFDVSPGSTDRTPIVRPGARVLPFETADRIQFSAPPRDVAFIERDRPVIDPVTGNVVEGLACDPTPENSGAGTQYRSVADYTSGARAVELRGVFGAALLTSGQVAIIDVEDFDAPCRRPMTTNPDPSQEDFRGCKADPELTSSNGVFTANNFRTVTDEVSCRMVEPHRARAGALGLTDSVRGVHAPSLRGFPQLQTPEAAQLLTNVQKPKLLGVDFELKDKPADPNPGAAQVFVGTIAYGRQSLDNPLSIAPGTADRYSVVLPFNEPRAYLATDTLSLAYEGTLFDQYPAGFLRVGAANQPFGDSEALTLNDPGNNFCDRGVYDEDLLKQTAHDRFGMAKDSVEAQDFAESHADYVVLMGQFPDADDYFWKDAPAECGRDACIKEFGDYDPKVPTKEPLASREFRIKDEYHQWFELAPRNTIDVDVAKRISMAQCCFPSGTPYVVRSSQQWILRGTNSGFRHKVHAVWGKDAHDNPQLDCQFDLDPRKSNFESRIFEICAKASPPGLDSRGDPIPGRSCLQACTIADDAVGVAPKDSATACIYNSPTARFAVYGGTAPSVRNMAFSWQVVGGFTPMRLDFSVLSPQVSPSALFGLPGMNWLTVVDGSSLGIVLLNLDTLAPLAPALN